MNTVNDSVEVPLFDLDPQAPPVPEPGDLAALRRYLAAIPAPAPRPANLPPLKIGMPPRINGLSEEARAATVTALLRIAHQLDTGEQAWLQPRQLAEWIAGVASDLHYDMDRHFQPRSDRGPRRVTS